MEQSWRDRIVSHPQVLHGKPCFKGTRIPVAIVFGFLSSGMTPEQVIEQYPDLTLDDLFAAFGFASELATFQTIELPA